MGFWHNVGEFLFFGWLCNKFRHREHTHDEYGGRYIDDNDDIEDEEDDRHFGHDYSYDDDYDDGLSDDF